MMQFLWPASLALLSLIPITLGVYVWMLRRKQRYVVRYSSLSLVREAMPKYSRLRRHLPFALFLLGLASLLVAMARPVNVVNVPAGRSTVILTIDVSRSMRQADIPPSRISAAKDAALAFIRSQPSNTQIGIVAFSGFAEMIHPPTNDQEALESAVESLTLGRRTAIGAGILEAVDAIAEVDSSIVPATGGSGGAPDFVPVPQGSYAPAIIVLLTDGVSTTGPMPVEAAQQAVERGIRVYTIGFGTETGEAPPPGAQGSFGDPWGGGGGGGWFRRGIDEDVLREVASLTGGRYYAASSASELQNVFASLPTNLVTREEKLEISVIFAALGALLAAAALALSLLWNPLL